MDRIKIKKKIIQYIKAAYKWHITGNGPITEGIGLIMSNLEEDILTSFGLPYMAFQYSEILQLEGFSDENLDIRALNLIERLTTEATLYLLLPIKNKEAFLTESKLNLTDAVSVLPLIDISTNAYNIFLYFDYFLRNIIDEERFLQLSKMATDADEAKETIIPYDYNKLHVFSIKKLTNQGYLFIKEFKEYLKYISKDQQSLAFKICNETIYVNDILLIVSKAFISYIEIIDENNAYIDLLIPYKEKQGQIRIRTSIKWFNILLKYTKYWTLSIPLLYITRQPISDNVNFVYPKQTVGNNIELDGAILVLEKIEVAHKINSNDIQVYELLYLKNKPIDEHTDHNGNELPF